MFKRLRIANTKVVLHLVVFYHYDCKKHTSCVIGKRAEVLFGVDPGAPDVDFGPKDSFSAERALVSLPSDPK